MSIRRAIEYHIKSVITEELAKDSHNGAFSDYQVVESLRQEERPIPSVIVIAGQATQAFNNLPDSYGNYYVTVSIMCLSSVDKETVDNFSNVSFYVQKVMREEQARKASRVVGLYLYEIESGSIGEENEGRDMGAGLNYTVVCNYTPE
jgi:hypothetical protein